MCLKRYLVLSMFIYMHMCLCLPEFVCTTGVFRGQRASDPLDLELKEAVSCLLWVLGAERESFVRTLSMFIH